MNVDDYRKAENLLRKFKGADYSFGNRAFEKVSEYGSELGRKAVIISGSTARRTGLLDRIKNDLERSGIKVVDVFSGARPNTPKEDVYCVAYQLSRSSWDFVIAIGGGSCLDGAKASITLSLYGGIIDDYFGVGKVSEVSKGKKIPLLAIQTASGSASHLTKYSNVTDTINWQKKLIVDDSIVPPKAIFQYDVTRTAPPDLTKDGALDGFSHCWEVWMGATGKSYYEEITEVASLGIKLILQSLPKALKNPGDLDARYGLGLGTDLGGYSIMIGGTNAAHLGSFSLVDVLPHGRACAILNPYYTVLFAPVIEDQLRRLARILREIDLLKSDIESLEIRPLAEAVAKAVISFEKSIGFPTNLREAGVTEKHIQKMVQAAKDPQLKMKLQNMPIPMDPDAGDIERLMEPTLYAAYTGNLSFIPRIE
ncbi:MAG: iron-containing alcohol dehydrogenase [Thaumarchaeota archaeon]|nr:iron-containing alcohol dehydrogenase [Nitrososphaerota archaeon]